MDAHAVARVLSVVKKEGAKEKRILLLSDGVGNTGSYSSDFAAQAAKQLGIVIETIGVGSNGMTRMPVARLPNKRYIMDKAKAEMDVKGLTQIATKTGGSFFLFKRSRKRRDLI